MGNRDDSQYHTGTLYGTYMPHDKVNDTNPTRDVDQVHCRSCYKAVRCRDLWVANTASTRAHPTNSL